MQKFFSLLMVMGVMLLIGRLIQLSRTTPAIVPTVVSAEIAAAPVPDALVRYCSTFAPMAIPDGTGAFITGTLAIPQSATILDANVQLSVTHSWVGDLMIRVSNGSAAPMVVNRPLLPASPPDGCSGDNIAGSYVDDEGMDGTWEDACINALPAYPAGSRLIGGDPVHKSLLSVFDGGSTAATWALSVSDNLVGDTGTLDGFCMEFTVPGGNTTPTATVTPTATPTSAPATNTPLPFTATASPTGTFIPPTMTGTATAVPTTATATLGPTSTGTPSTIPPTPTGTMLPATPTLTLIPTTPTMSATPAITVTGTAPTMPLLNLYLPLIKADAS